MARRIVRATDYVFDTANKTLTVPSFIVQERLLLITNVTRGIIIYNFAEPTLLATSWTFVGDPINPKTQIVLNYNTSAMASTDVLAVMVDEYNESVTFADTLLDSVEKLRVAAPQSLMDTDFEYSVQPSKWEALFLANNYPSFFAKTSGGNAIAVTSVLGDSSGPRSTITVTTSTLHGLVPGNIISIQDTTNFRAEGTFVINTVPTPFSITYAARGVVSGEIFVSNYTTVYGGDVFDNAHIPGGNTNISNTLRGFTASSNGGNPSVITISFSTPHGLFPGTPIIINNTSGINGNWVINTVPTPTTVTFEILDTVVTAISLSSNSIIYVKPEGYIQHRPLDGGVSLTTMSNAMGMNTIRQTRRYFRYQSGKGIQFSTGAKLTPTYDIKSISIDSVSTLGTRVVTIGTLQDHGLQPGATIVVDAIETVSNYNPYNGTFIVASIIDTNSFTYNVNLTQTIFATDQNPGGANSVVTVSKWVGATTRAGMYDDQNGFFWEYDGQYLYVGRRFSNKELMGRVATTQYSNIISGTGTLFRKQLLVGDRIVLRGQSYLVNNIVDDTTLHVNPAYRGISTTNVIITKTQEIRVRQDSWNTDKCDGEGPSGYLADPKKMQMIYIDYTWYGAGYIRWGLRSIKGDIVYVHRMANNNINNAAYQRSGNLPARYEAINEPKRAKLVAGATATLGSTLNGTDTTMYVDNVDSWPTAGFVYIKNNDSCEIASYSAIGSYNATVKGYPITIARRQTITQYYPTRAIVLSTAATSATTFSPDPSVNGSGISQVAVQTITNTCAPQISHWGSSVIMDGRFDNDAQYTFTAGMTKTLSIPFGQTRPMMAIRLAPSADNGVARNFGVRELVNRMQMQLSSMGVSTNGQFLIRGLLNPGRINYNNYASSALTVSKTGVTGSSSGLTLTLPDVSNVVVGMTIASGSAAGAQVGAVITGIAGYVITMSLPNTGNVSGTVIFGNVPSYVGLPFDWDRETVGSGSLAQVLYFDNCGNTGGASQTVSGSITQADEIFSFYSENGSPTSFNITNYDLKSIRDMGNSILSGNGNATSPSYPNGPDILVITATNLATSGSGLLAARVSWTEAQA